MPTSSLQAEPGFRHRGIEVSRLETFVDAAFAFSLTLLVISQNEVPDSVAEMRDALRRIPTFIACFLLIALFWAAHRRWSRRFGLEDSASIVLSLAFVAVVMVYVYPLRMVTAAGLAMLTGGWVPSELGRLGANWLLDVQTLFIVYGAGFALLSGLLWLLNAHARKLADPLQLDARERFEVDTEIGIQRIATLAGLVSITIAFAVIAIGPTRSPWIISLPMWTYALLGVVMPLYGARRGRLLQRLDTSA